MEIMPVDKKAVAQSLTALRKSRFKSREAICKVLGMSVSRYAEYEQGRVPLPYDVAWAVADIMECSMDDIGGRKWAANPGVPELAGGESPGPAAAAGADPGALQLAERIANLSVEGRKAVQEFLSFEESRAEKTGDFPGDVGQPEARAAAS